MSSALNLGNIVLPGDFPNMSQFTIPVTAGLLFMGLFGESAKRSPLNLAGSGIKAAVIGAPVFDGVKGRFDGSNYLDLGNIETSDMTLMVVTKNPDWETTQSGVIGSYSSAAPGDGGVNIFERATTATTGQLSGLVYRPPSGAGSSMDLAVTNSSFTLMALRTAGSPNGRGYLQNLTAGTASEQVSAVARTANANNKFMVGRLNSSTFVGRCEIVAALAYNRSVSNAELAALAAWIRTYAASKGVTV